MNVLVRYFNFLCQMMALGLPMFQYYFGYGTMFMMAYSNKDFRVIMDINHYGEANLEIALWIIQTPFMIWGLYLNYKCIERKLSEDLKDE